MKNERVIGGGIARGGNLRTAFLTTGSLRDSFGRS
jgi:hypothetical protein